MTERDESIPKLNEDDTPSRISVKFTGVDYISRIDVEVTKNLIR
jgi:hypothetical protein